MRVNCCWSQNSGVGRTSTSEFRFSNSDFVTTKNNPEKAPSSFMASFSMAKDNQRKEIFIFSIILFPLAWENFHKNPSKQQPDETTSNISQSFDFIGDILLAVHFIYRNWNASGKCELTGSRIKVRKVRQCGPLLGPSLSKTYGIKLV